MLKVFPLILAALMANFAATAEGVTEAAAAPGVNLPTPPRTGTVSLEESLAHRRSVRDFSDEALTLDEISRLAWAAQGVVAPGHRTAPSAGATYPLEIYLAAGNVENLAAGVYRYLPERHRLETVSEGDIRQRLGDAAVNQEWLSSAPLVMAIAAVFDRTAARYGRRAERYVDMESGHAAQNLLLQTTVLGLGATPVGAFDDDEVSRLLHLPVGETPLYLIPVGRPAHP